MVAIQPGLSIPASELRFETSTASGPGGQHVNRSQTRITLIFDVNASVTLSAAQKLRIRERLVTRIDRHGRLRVRCGRHRRQSSNRDEVVARFAKLIAAALRREASRIATRPSKAAKRRRIDDKQRRGRVKQQRRRPRSDDD